jgi:CxxC motif-containing protein (DUF1111 family)
MAKRTFAYTCSLASRATILLASVALTSLAPAQTQGPRDPGVRGGAAGAGDPIPGLTGEESAFFEVAKDVFQEVDAVADGLGPRFNLDSCVGCHSQPAVGGTSPAVNPQVAVATLNGATNTVPSFIRLNGPVREARFVRNRDGSPDGGVHGLFVITGRADAPGCNIRQPDFAGELSRNNVVFRIPTPTFGLGLVEMVTDRALEASLAANGDQKRALGISGRFNRSGNDGTIQRFGWKAQNKSLLMFAGEAYNVEIGVTNDLFQNEREGDPACQFNSTHPESPTSLESEGGPNPPSPSAGFQSDIALFAAFMRLLAPPTPAGATATATASATSSTASAATTDASATSSVLTAAAGTTATTSSRTSTTSTTATVDRGRQVFGNIGCSACHTRRLTSGKATVAALSEKPFEPYSDFAVHDMGDRLADGVSQGGAGGREFRTAPLWGVGQRIFFLHDGRTSDLGEAIRQHSSNGSEANQVVQNYNNLSSTDRQAVLNFLRSL